MDIRYKTLSTKSAQVIQHFSNINQPGFSLREAGKLLRNSSDNAVRKLMRDMVNRGLLLRLKDGVYWMIPYEQEAKNYFPNWHRIAGYLAGNTKYYIGYYSAMELHNMITQPSLIERIVVNKQVKPSMIEVKGIKFQFIYHNKNHFFGQKEMWIDGFNKVICSDLEKTFVDGLYKPDYAGGITEIAKGLYKSKETIDFKKLYNYCKHFNAQSVIKRLGFLLELLEIYDPIIDRLQKLKSNSFILLEPSYKKNGKLISRWSIQQNVDTTDIISPIYT